MTTHYTIQDAPKDAKCYVCGGVATMMLVATEPEPDNGYVDEIPMCEDCAEKREV